MKNANQIVEILNNEYWIPVSVPELTHLLDEPEMSTIKKYKYSHSSGFELPDGYADEFIRKVRKMKDPQKKLLKRKKQTDTAMKDTLPNILITSGFYFDGYRITKYSGYISGDDAIEIPRGGIYGKDNGQKLTDALVKIRRKAINELKKAAYDLGCNAVIGVDFDYLTLEPETISGTIHYYEPYVICVTANGNAVVIEKE